MRDAAAKSQEIDEPFINNLTTPFSVVIVNPENPDSKPIAAARRISIDGRVYDVHNRIFIQYYCRDAMPLVFSPTDIYLKFTPFRLVLNQDFQDFQDCRERLRFGGKGYL
jgi:hypothetical protein